MNSLEKDPPVSRFQRGSNLSADVTAIFIGSRETPSRIEEHEGADIGSDPHKPQAHP